MEKKFFIQITAGRGPIECAATVGKVGKMICDELYKICQSYPTTKYFVPDYNEHKDSDRFNTYSCYMSMTIEVRYEHDEIFENLKNEWEGTIKWIATKNSFRPNHKRKNWFVGVSFYELPEPVKVEENDIRYETMRSSGAGGQNVNKVESAVRAVYVPTGVSVLAQDSRDQVMNKKLARQRLIDKLSLIDKYKMDVLKADNWSEHTALKRGCEIKTLSGEL